MTKVWDYKQRCQVAFSVIGELELLPNRELLNYGIISQQTKFDPLQNFCLYPFPNYSDCEGHLRGDCYLILSAQMEIPPQCHTSRTKN